MGSLEGITRLIVAVGFLVVAVVVFIAANSCSMSIRERSSETAVLKAIGFGRRRVLGLFLAEAVSLSALAGAAGALGAYGFFKLLARLGATGMTSSLGPLSFFVMTITVLVEGLFLSLLVGMLAGIVPSWGAARRSVVESLREAF
jgi:putative ABC transport system permease protein